MIELLETNLLLLLFVVVTMVLAPLVGYKAMKIHR